MICAEKLRLLGNYREAVSELFAAATGVQSKTGKELQESLELTKAARAKCVQARLALQAHKAQHGCARWYYQT